MRIEGFLDRGRGITESKKQFNVVNNKREASRKVKKGDKKKFQIETSTSLATVKGTKFWVIVDKQGYTRVVCLAGLLELMNKKLNKAVTIGKGNTGLSGDGELDVRETKDEDLQIGEGTGSADGKKDTQKAGTPPKPNERVLNVKFKDTKGEEKDLEIILQKKK